MNGDRVAMSQRERDRLKVMAPVQEGKRTQAEAARLLKLCVRQVRRLQRRLEQEGDAGLIHKLRGRPSNHRHPESLRRQVVEIYRHEMPDFNLTMASEKLAARKLAVPARTLRDWLSAEGVWQPKYRRDPHRARRQRRACFGELVQADGSHPDWLEGRGPWMVLVAMIDDATSKATARFYPGETTEAYMDLLGRYVKRHGRMAALYVDRDSIFRAEDRHPDDPRPCLTQFSRALEDLLIDLILAHSPQAKGRIERFFETAQDRLVKELRLAGATTIGQANAVLEKTFLPWFNRWCRVQPASPNDAHRPRHPSMRLKSILSLQEKRRVSNDYTIRLDNQIYQLLPPALPQERGDWVTVERRLDGTLHVRLRDTYLKYRRIGPALAPGALPPDPRSLAHLRTPAAGGEKQGRVAAATRPSAVRPASGRSGRTPAEPCPPRGTKTVPQNQPYRPPPDHPWRRGEHFNSPKPADISIHA
jgi:transposase